jgi:4a-hydroxytetrahydrobiopterin dehydratase
MMTLADRRCVACTPESRAVTADEQRALLAHLDGWEIVMQRDMPVLRASFPLPDFAAALALVNRIGALAEEADHHPCIVLEWGRVEVSWWTHTIGGLHENDFIMAARTSRALPSREPKSG